MAVRRVVPDIQSEAAQESREFYGLLGFEEVMNLGWIMTLASPSSPAAQISVMNDDKTAPVVPDISVEVDDVDAAYAVMRASGAEIVHPLQDEEWGVRRGGAWSRPCSPRRPDPLAHPRASSWRGPAAGRGHRGRARQGNRLTCATVGYRCD
ncbi:VOC family protein [Streptomyces griseosporeus]|uniref:VOC family protein n=1 Tax=Streptomyces griseosporeus TaxID=1910 RepID=UPI0036FBFFCC